MNSNYFSFSFLIGIKKKKTKKPRFPKSMRLRPCQFNLRSSLWHSGCNEFTPPQESTVILEDAFAFEGSVVGITTSQVVGL